MRPEKVVSIASRLLVVSLGRTIAFTPTYPRRHTARTITQYFSTTTTYATRRASYSAHESNKHGDNKNNLPSLQVSSLLKFYYEKLKERNVPEAEESIIHLCAKALDLPWETGYRDLREILSSSSSPGNKVALPLASRIVTTEQQRDLDDMMTRRIETLEPIQYLVGQWDFMDHTFWIQPPLLCPRPETEELVEHACQDLAKFQQEPSSSPLRVLDIGCGTGCIGISISSRMMISSSSSSASSGSSSRVVVEALSLIHI